MQLSEKILRHLAEHGPCYTRQLAVALGARGESIARACRCLRRYNLVHSVESLHGLTAEGQRWVVTGGWVPCQRQGRAASSEGRTLRQKAWGVLRMADKTTVADLMRTICDGGEKGAADNLRNYLSALYRAGMVGKTARTGAYFLRPEANTGPRAPAYNRVEKSVTDRNTGKTVHIGGKRGE